MDDVDGDDVGDDDGDDDGDGDSECPDSSPDAQEIPDDDSAGDVTADSPPIVCRLYGLWSTVWPKTLT